MDVLFVVGLMYVDMVYGHLIVMDAYILNFMINYLLPMISHWYICTQIKVHDLLFVAEDMYSYVLWLYVWYGRP